MAYADDLILMAETTTGLKKNFELVKEGLGRVGLSINAKKSASHNIAACRGKWIVDSSPFYEWVMSQ